MANTDTGAALTAAQRAAQLALKAAMLREFATVWPLLNPQAIDNSWPNLLAAAFAVITRYRAASATSAGTYYTALRRAETDQLVAPALVLAGTPDPAALSTSMWVTGPVGMKARVGKGVPPRRASKLALVDACGAASRHVLGGGRGTRWWTPSRGTTSRKAGPARPVQKHVRSVACFVSEE